MTTDRPTISDSADSRSGRLVGHGLVRLLASMRRRLPPSLRRRAAVASVAYGLLIVFGGTVALVRLLAGSWSWAVDLALAGAVVAPLVLAFVYDRLTALKTPWFEI